MNRSLAALAAGALLLSASPLAFADESTESSSSVESSSSSSVESSSSTTSTTSSSSSLDRNKEWMKPCLELTGLKKAQCIVKHNPAKKLKKDRVQRMNDDKILNRTAKCEDEEGDKKVECLRKHGIKSMIKKAVKSEIKRTIRGKVRDSRSSSSESSESESSED